MDRNLIRTLPQLQLLFDAVDKFKLDKVVWEVLGGLPHKYEDLKIALQVNNGQGTLLVG